MRSPAGLCYAVADVVAFTSLLCSTTLTHPRHPSAISVHHTLLQEFESSAQLITLLTTLLREHGETLAAATAVDSDGALSLSHAHTELLRSTAAAVGVPGGADWKLGPQQV
jgi:hypothetical protein